MSPIHRFRPAVSTFVAVLIFALSAPIAIHAEDEVVVSEKQDLAPVAGPGPSGTIQVPGDVRWAAAGTIAPTASVAASRVHAAQQALLSGDLGSRQENALFAVVAAGASWDETIGYRSVEASRAAQAQQALLSGDLGSLQEEALMAAVATAMAWDETSGYGAVEATRAARSPLPAPAAAPTLRDASATTQTSPLFTVTGRDFTAGGRVYLAIYDQMGAQLYETRWITASRPLVAVMGPTGHEAAGLTGPGGTLRAAFANLCGATAMMRGYDEVTTTWSNWLTVEPACATYVEPRNGPR